MRLLTTVTLLASLSVFAGAGSSGGGDIDDLRRYHSIPEDKLTEILTVKSYSLKKMALDLIKFGGAGDEHETKPAVKRFYNIIDRFKLHEIEMAVLSAPFIVDEELFATKCVDAKYRAACTTNNVPGSPIYFSLNRLLLKETSLSELGGLLMHELSHWYLGHGDHPDFEVGAYFEEFVQNGGYTEKTFTFTEGELIHVKTLKDTRMFSGKEYMKKYKYLHLAISFNPYDVKVSDPNFYLRDVQKSRADSFCQTKGLDTAKAFRIKKYDPSFKFITLIWFNELKEEKFKNLYYHYEYRATKSDWEDYYVFDEVTCI